MHMHMFGLMYAPSDRVTLMAMAPYIDKRMTHLQNPMMGDAVFKTTTKGIGDIKLGRWWGFWTMGDIRCIFRFRRRIVTWKLSALLFSLFVVSCRCFISNIRSAAS
ncbi:hypothetical protein FIV45_17200 [Paremcibacter congregatus]|nr:hypothetical protein FIV45_17200 [Paremcibacter congregatus]